MIGSFKIEHEGGYYLIKEVATAKETGKLYCKAQKSYPTATGAVNFLLSEGFLEEDVSNECNRAYQSYVQKESQALIKDKAKEAEKKLNFA